MGNDRQPDDSYGMIRRKDQSMVVSDMEILGSLTKPEVPITRRIAIGKKDSRAKQTSDGKGTYRLPIKLDHFLITMTETDETGDYLVDQKFHRDIIKDEKPREIPVQLLFDRLGLNFIEYLALYASRVPWCKGNGVKASRLVAENSMERKEVECPCDFLKKGKCKPHIRVLVKLPGMGVGEAAAFRSTGKNTIKAIKGSLALIKESVAYCLDGIPFEAAPLVGLPLMMVYGKKTVTDPKGNQRSVPVVRFRLDLNEDEVKALMKKRQKGFLETANFLRGLTRVAPEMYKIEKAREEIQKAEILTKDEDPKEAKAIQEEFHPEEQIPKEPPTGSMDELEAASKRHATEVDTALDGAPDDDDIVQQEPPEDVQARPESKPKKKGRKDDDSFL